MNILNKINKIFQKEKTYEQLYNKGVDLFKRKKYQKALDIFLLALEKKYTSKIYYNIGLCYQNLKKYDLAKKNYERAISKNSDDSDCYYNLALIYLRSNDFNNAKMLLEKALTYNKGKDILRELLYINLKLKDFEKVNNLIKENFNNTKDIIQIAQKAKEYNVSLSNFEYLDFAISLLLPLQKIERNNSEIFYILSICHSKKAMWQEAKTFGEIALKLNPKSFELNENLGIILFSNENFEQAIKYFEKIINNKKASFSTYSHIIQTYKQLKKLEHCKKYIKKLLKKFPNEKEFTQKILNELTL